jgi:hypothetical protein
MTRILTLTGIALLGLACASGGAVRRPEPVSIEIRGVVVDVTTHAPAAGVRVRLVEANLGVRTDSTGTFQIRGHVRPDRYVLDATLLGYTAQQRRIRIRSAGTVNVGTLRVRPSVIHLDDLIVPECMRFEQAPTDTAPGSSVRAERDSRGTFWMVCRPPRH